MSTPLSEIFDADQSQRRRATCFLGQHDQLIHLLVGQQQLAPLVYLVDGGRRDQVLWKSVEYPVFPWLSSHLVGNLGRLISPFWASRCHLWPIDRVGLTQACLANCVLRFSTQSWCCSWCSVLQLYPPWFHRSSHLIHTISPFGIFGVHVSLRQRVYARRIVEHRRQYNRKDQTSHSWPSTFWWPASGD